MTPETESLSDAGAPADQPGRALRSRLPLAIAAGLSLILAAGAPGLASGQAPVKKQVPVKKQIPLRGPVPTLPVSAEAVLLLDLETGKVLFEIDDRLFKAHWDSAEASVDVAKARVGLAEANLVRRRDAALKGVIAKEEVDVAEADLQAANASVKVARANAEEARTTYDRARIYAPETGRLSRRRS